MATSSSSSSSSSQGSAPGVLGKVPQTAGDLIIYSLEDLKACDFKRFRNKLSDYTYGDKLPIPQGKLENADWTTTKDLLIDKYGEGALDVTIHVFTLIDLMGPANVLQERRAQHANQKKTTHDNRLSDISKEHRESEKFQRIKEYNSRMGEAVHLQKRFTKLLMINGPQNKEGKEEEIKSFGRRHLQIMEKRSPTTIQALFDADEYGFTPEIVVLQGAAGIGKTMTSKKIMLDWASGDLYKDKFDFVFYLSCREINTIPGNISLVGLLSRTCRLSSDDLVSILEDPGSQRKLLTIVDGFDELRWTLEEKSEGCPDISMKTHKEIILQSLLRRQVLPQSSLIITTRSLAMEKLNTFIDDSRNVEIQGFTRDDREEYVHKFFGNKEDADKVLSIIKDNDVVYTMCAVPITCWIVCTVMKQEIRKDLDSIQCHTMTSIYLLYLEVLLTHHSKKEQSVPRKQTCLKKLCALANQGVLNRQILFEKKDLERHGLSLDEVESVFLNENIFHWDVRNQTCYSFIHLSVQEFLAALYYGMDDGSGSMEGTFLPEICEGKPLDDFRSDYSHLVLSVQFLFGLLNENPVKTFSESTGITISLRAKPAIIEWAMKGNEPAMIDRIMKGINRTLHTQTIFCLYETQDEDFIRRVMSGCKDLELCSSHTDHLWMKRNYYKQLNYCLKTLKRENFQSLHFSWLTVGPEIQKLLSPFLHRSQKVRFWQCTITSKDCRGKDNAEEEDSSSSEDEMKCDSLSFLISSSGYKMKCDSLSFLMNPESKIQELELVECGVTSSACDDLRSILINNRSLTRLDLSGNKLEDSGIKLLCEGLRHPGCTLQSLRVWGCKGTLWCCDDLCSVISTNRTLTYLQIILDDDEKISESEERRRCADLRSAGFSVYREG
ncbi:NACHT, LRR and PYD domains-containing protein 3-like [Aquarana catesbeiana]|uniref:NACHT, LRR and PYD domains-containing protein 3-like n=1 Tax=Aquarana catesbeiana TaxID=8400 RepID=UPI003CC9BEA2